MNGGVQCVHDHVTKCFDHKRKRIIYQLLAGTEEVIKLLCKQGKFRTGEFFKPIDFIKELR